ncbi:hypothetical protein L596_002497 [Steinernema carpocapsae]|nr:hypothetical protein L596_002497 [Steinernema carpocapsae]
MIGYLKAFDRLKFDIPVNSAFLNGWTPSPLILSGVIAGKPMRVDQKPPSMNRRRVNSVTMDDIQEDEVGMSALDLLDESGTAIRSENTTPTRLHHVSRRPSSSASMPHLRAPGGPKNDDEDDGSSVYSHPSMMDGGLLFNNPYAVRPTAIYSPVLSSTPETSNYLATAMELPSELQTSEVVVKHRRHRFRRSSAGSGEEPRSRKASQARPESTTNHAQVEVGEGSQ